MEFSRTQPWQEKKPWRWQEGEYTVTRGGSWSGPGCHNGCGVLLYTDKEGRLVKVEGDLENPWNQGRLCARCLTLPDVTNHNDRLKYPMKRIGERGENRWERISWDEAYDTIVREFNKVKEDYGPESVVFAEGTGRDIGAYFTRLGYSFGTPNIVYYLSGIACYLPRVAEMAVTTGAFARTDCSQHLANRYDDPSWQVPECIVIWGGNPIVSNSSFFGHWIVDCMERGSKLIVVDPKLTWLAARAEIWLQIRPGTDAALALAMLNVIITEDLYDHDFVEKWTYGFDELATRAAEYPVDKVAAITWIPEEKIRAAARMFAASKPAAIDWGLAVDMTKESLPAAMAISSLWTITGNLDVPGGMVFAAPPFGGHSGQMSWGEDLVSPEVFEKRFGGKKYPILSWGVFPCAQPDAAIEAMETGIPYPVKAAWIQSSNVIACIAAEPKRAYAAFMKCDFIVVVDLFMTPTAVALADIVLPAQTYPERDGLALSWDNMSIINKVTTIEGDTKSDMEINMELGKRFNPEAWPWENVQEMFTDMMGASGATWEELRDRGGNMWPKHEYRRYEKGMLRPDGQPGFMTPTGRVELYSTLFESWGLDPLPYFEEPTEGPGSTPELMKEYPLVLTTGARSWASFHSEHRQISKLRAIKEGPQLEIHPDTAARYDIKDGDWVWIENSRGRCRQRARLTPTLDPRVVNADHGWWFPEKPGAWPSLFGSWDVNPNHMVPMLPGRSGFGANYKSLICKVYKVKEGEM